MAFCCAGSPVDALQWREHKKHWSPRVPSGPVADDQGVIPGLRSYSIFDMLHAEGSPNPEREPYPRDYFTNESSPFFREGPEWLTERA